MNTSYKAIKYTVLILFFVSCETEKVIDYDTYYEGDKIVVHGYINQKDGVNVIVKKTLSPDDLEANDVLTDAHVYLVTADESIELDKIDAYLYTLPATALEMSQEYRILVESVSLSSIFSTNQSLFEGTFIDTLQIEEGGFSRDLQLTYNNPNLDSRYYYKIFEYFDGELVESSEYYDTMFDPYGIIKPSTIGVQYKTYNVYSTELDSLVVELYTFSDDLSRFCESFSDSEGTSEDPFVDYRLAVYSNIENGYGLFASYSYDTKTLIVEE